MECVDMLICFVVVSASCRMVLTRVQFIFN